MKIQIISDLHMEFFSDQKTAMPQLSSEAEVVVLAGDIHVGLNGIEAFLNLACESQQFVYVLGNHEGYGQVWEDLVGQARALTANNPYFHFLYRDSVQIRGVEFIGATLWTSGHLGSLKVPAVLSNQICQRSVADFKRIQSNESASQYITFAQTNRWHELDLKYIDQALDKTKAGKKVVVTHHLPHENSVVQKHKQSLINAAFASDVPEEIIQKADLWIHGHTHDSLDYKLGQCRVVCNPRGYFLKSNGQYENRVFDPEKVIEV